MTAFPISRGAARARRPGLIGASGLGVVLAAALHLAPPSGYASVAHAAPGLRKVVMGSRPQPDSRCPVQRPAKGPDDLDEFLEHASRHLPRFRALFEAAADQHGLPWPLLAAQAYAESRWDPEARSPSGVLGMMQLTRAAAAEVGVADRLDPRDSITGGARYLALMLEKIPDEVSAHTDREAFALVAYNIGFTRLLDARRAALGMGVDADTWAGLRSALGVLGRDPDGEPRRRRVGRLLARGAIAYVERVQQLRGVLRMRDGAQRAPASPCGPWADAGEAAADRDSSA